MFVLWRHAESQRSRAETYLAQAARLLGELIDLNAGAAGGQSRDIDPNRKIELLRVARRDLVALADQLPDRRAYYSQLLAVDQGLSSALEVESRGDESREVLKNSLRDAREARRLFPEDARNWEFWILSRLSEYADKDGNFEEFTDLYNRAIKLAEEALVSEPGSFHLTSLIIRRQGLARRFVEAGRIDEARALLLANRRKLAEVPRDQVDSTVIVLRVSAPIFEREFGIELPPWPGRAGSLGSPEVDRLPPDAWAEAAVHALGLDDPDGPTASVPSETALKFAESLKELASLRRRRKQLDRAQQCADRLMALALRMQREGADGSYTRLLLLAYAHEQIYKNAWQDHDNPATDPARKPAIRETIVLNLRECVSADREAMEWAPGNLLARRHFQYHQRRLEDLLHPQPPSH